MRTNQEIYDLITQIRDDHIAANKLLMEEIQKLSAESRIDAARAEIRLRMHIVDNLNHIINFANSNPHVQQYGANFKHNHVFVFDVEKTNDE